MARSALDATAKLLQGLETGGGSVISSRPQNLGNTGIYPEGIDGNFL